MKINREAKLAELERIFESCGSPFSQEEEARRWLQNYKNSRPLFKLYDFEKIQFSKSLQPFEKELLTFSDDERAKFYSFVFKKTRYYEVAHVAINYFKRQQRKSKPELIKYWPLLKGWITRIDNWAHADMIASLYCEMQTEAPEMVTPTLEEWGQSSKPWRARMAIVSLLYYYNPKRHRPRAELIEEILLRHLYQDHYYLQKAIGWCLREYSKAYPSRYSKLMNKIVLKLSSTAFTTSVEKCERPQKEKWKALRKESRVKARS
ncbi:MAG: DNA alkylation repair protein [Bdellovibrionota bacterium]|nr:DNA alkylation repair protein [Bdellovibrionota bacterium]